MTNINELTIDLSERIAIELQKELKVVLVLDQYELLKKSIKIHQVKNDYIIKMDTSWLLVEYLENPFIRFTLNTKMDDILKKVTTQMSR